MTIKPDRGRGTVKSWLPDRFFGFIIPDDPSAEDLFFHREQLEAAGIDEVRKGDRIQYRRIDSNKGPRAVDLELI